MEIPSFLSQKGNSLIYNGEGEFIFYFPESYFSSVKKNPIAQIIGSYVTSVGICDWAIISKNGKVSDSHPFKYPTIFMCKPDHIEKVKNLKLNNKGRDYRILHFKNGDEVISDMNTPEIIDNVETIFRIMSITGNNIPDTVPYDKMHDYFPESMNLNGEDFGINMQLFGIFVSGLCRDPKDLSREFRYTSMNDMCSYQQISVKQIPKYISPYVALTSENWDESLMAAILLSDEESKAESPIEKVVTN